VRQSADSVKARQEVDTVPLIDDIRFYITQIHGEGDGSGTTARFLFHFFYVTRPYFAPVPPLPPSPALTDGVSGRLPRLVRSKPVQQECIWLAHRVTRLNGETLLVGTSQYPLSRARKGSLSAPLSPFLFPHAVYLFCICLLACVCVHARACLPPPHSLSYGSANLSPPACCFVKDHVAMRQAWACCKARWNVAQHYRFTMYWWESA
jgi:hypothetical protein